MRSSRVVLCVPLVVLAALFCSGCGIKLVESRFKLPPRSRELAEPQRVVVQNFDGPRGGEATSVMRSAITAGGQHTLLMDSASGVTAIVQGSTSDDEYQGNVESDVRSECVARNKEGKCTQKQNFTYYTLSEKCTSRVTVRVVRTSDQSVLIDKALEDNASVSKTAKGQRPASQRGTICGKAFRDVMATATRYVTTYWTTQRIPFHKVSDSSYTEKGLELVKSGKIAESLPMFKSAIEDPKLKDKDRAWAQYNLGLAYYASGQFDLCAQQMEEARAVVDEMPVRDHLRVCQEYLE